MGQDGRPTTVDAAPVGATVSYLLAHTKGFLAQGVSLGADIKNGYYSTQIYIIKGLSCIVRRIS